MGITVKATIRQAQYAGIQTGQQRLANRPLAGSIGTQIGGKDGVASALDKYRALGLRVARMTGTAARVAKGLDIVRFVGNLQVYHLSPLSAASRRQARATSFCKGA